MKIKRNIGILYSISFLQGMVFYSSVSTLYRQAAGITLFQLFCYQGISLCPDYCAGTSLGDSGRLHRISENHDKLFVFVFSI